MGLVFFNTLTRQKEEFVPLEAGKVRMYTCGPTVYDYPHIGNYRTFLFEDLLRRYLKYKGFQVTQVMNLTDVDDRTIAGSQAEGISLDEFTTRYKKIFFEDLKTLNVEPAEVYPDATKHVKEMVEIIKKLLEKKYAYQMEGSIYFKISVFPEYGKLSKMNLEELKAGARIKADDYEKEQVSDFALWKAWDEKDGNVFWETEIGKGRPGWHIECSAMSMKYLGEHFDIHTGGVDNIFPHHENEIAQSQAATGKKFVNYWLHSEHLLVDHKKMAKRLGNFYTLRDILNQGWYPMAIRYLLLSTYYRQQLNFTFEGLEAAKNSLQRIYDFMDELKTITKEGKNSDVEKLVSLAKEKFEAGLDDDLNVSVSLAAIFDLIYEVNILLRENKVSKTDAELILNQLDDFDRVLGYLKKPEESLNEIASELVEKREKARQNKDWKLADQLRKQLLEMGIILEDTASGTKWKKKI
jgi:cysteinyl-tRNA synthetase